MADETFDVLLRVKAEGDEALKVLTKQLAIIQTETKKTQTALQQTGEGGNRFRYSLQNLGYQAQDFAVQVGGGTSALRAFSQQMPQAIDALQNMFGEATTLGKFLGGPWGVLLGVAAGALGPLIAELFNSGEAAKTAGEKAKEAALRMAELRGEYTAAGVAAAQSNLDDALRSLEEYNKEGGRQAALRAREIELKVLPPLREALDIAKQQYKLNQMGVPSHYDKGAATADAKAAREAATAARKAAAEQAREEKKADAAAKKVDDLVKRFRTSINDIFQASDLAVGKYINTLNEAADPTIAYAQGVKELAEAQAAQGLSAEGAALQMQKLGDAYKTAQIALYKLRDAAAGGVGASFNKEMEKLIANQDVLKHGWEAFGQASSDALAGLIAGTVKARDAVKSLLADLLKLLAKQAILRIFGGSPAGSFGASLLKGFGFAKGAVIDQGGVVPFARGGIVDRPQVFPFASGVGLMGEAGPEAIVPMRRDAAGNLGIAATPVNVNIHNNAGAAIAVTNDGAGNIDVIVSKAVAASRAAVAADVQRGGNPLARTLEKTYGVNRAMGAFS